MDFLSKDDREDRFRDRKNPARYGGGSTPTKIGNTFRQEDKTEDSARVRGVHLPTGSTGESE